LRKHTKAEMLVNCVSNSERRRIETQVPDDESIKKGEDMQSAEELADLLSRKFAMAFNPDLRHRIGVDEGIKQTVTLIRARDREIVEKCRAALEKEDCIIMDGGRIANLDCCIYVLDSILHDFD